MRRWLPPKSCPRCREFSTTGQLDFPVFKSPGDRVAAGDVVGLIEIMKSFDEVRVEQAGTFLRYAIGHGEEIMAGQALAVIEA